ncbi:MAG: NAD-dependent epimerase/dehydratase family protein [Bacteroidota bacterium]|nr:NAD-dependent epimerase/dehydratase family protein [Bacteroidota bacterium]
MKRIAILGVSGYIGRALSYELSTKRDIELMLFSGSEEKVMSFFHRAGIQNVPRIFPYESFNKESYDVVINCTGIGNPVVLTQAPETVLEVTEKFDNLILENLAQHNETLYVYLSSGIVKGQQSPYALSKIQAEGRHRAHSDLRIVDIRAYSFFSRFADIDSGFLMSEILGAIKNHTVFETSSEDIIRDFVCAADLWRFIEAFMEQKVINGAYDIYSVKPVSKFELLEALHASFGLEYKIKEEAVFISPTGLKNTYIPLCHKAGKLGYVPKYSSLQCIIEELEKV